MQSSEAPGRGFSGEDYFDRKVMEVYRETSGLIHATLVAQYRIPEPKALSIEKDLELWFYRFCRRQVTASPRENLPFLLLLACTFARGYQRNQVGRNLLSPDRELRKLLEQKPEVFAGALTAAPSGRKRKPRVRDRIRRFFRP